MEYILIKSNRKSFSIEINDNLEVVVRVPYFATKRQIDKIINQHTNWIEKHKKIKEKQLSQQVVLSEKEIEHLKNRAKEILPKRVQHYSKIMDLTPSSVKITSAKKRFGSCSPKNGLCFSFILMQYPEKAIDYVVVHELAHIRHHNHQKEFYDLIKTVLPDYKEREKLLKNPPVK